MSYSKHSYLIGCQGIVFKIQIQSKNHWGFLIFSMNFSICIEIAFYHFHFQKKCCFYGFQKKKTTYSYMIDCHQETFHLVNPIIDLLIHFSGLIDSRKRVQEIKPKTKIATSEKTPWHAIIIRPLCLLPIYVIQPAAACAMPESIQTSFSPRYTLNFQDLVFRRKWS